MKIQKKKKNTIGRELSFSQGKTMRLMNQDGIKLLFFKNYFITAFGEKNHGVRLDNYFQKAIFHYFCKIVIL